MRRAAGTFRALLGRAVRAMTTHLSPVETRLRPRICEPVDASLDAVLAEEIAAAGPSARFAAAPGDGL